MSVLCDSSVGRKEKHLSCLAASGPRFQAAGSSSSESSSFTVTGPSPSRDARPGEPKAAGLIGKTRLGALEASVHPQGGAHGGHCAGDSGVPLRPEAGAWGRPALAEPL